MTDLPRTLSAAIDVPTTRVDPDGGHTFHGRWFHDPYAWLEQLDEVDRVRILPKMGRTCAS